jgi:4-amino-4-deoxy-L-arabinose transferase-like glycosyltransferase
LPSRIRPATWFLIAILALAVVLRVAWPGIIEFKYDEATMARRAIMLIREGVWPTRGVTSSLGIPHPPLTAYLLVIPFAITLNPAFAAAFMGALGVLTVYLAYLLGKRYFDERVGLIAALLFTISPWVAFYSRKLWAQNVPAVTLLFMLALYALVIDRKPKALVWSLIALGALMGLHLGGFAFIGVLVLALALHPRLFKPPEDDAPAPGWWRWALIGLAGLILLSLPYVMEFITGQTRLSQVFASAGNSVERRPLSHLAIYYTADIATGQHFEALTGGSFYNPYGDFTLPNLDAALNWTEVWLIITSMAYLVVKTAILLFRKNPPADAPEAAASRHGLLVLWLVLPIGMWALSRGEIVPHHFIQTYPAQLLALAVMLVDAFDALTRRRPSLKPILTGVFAVWLAVLTAWHATTYLGMLRFFATTPNTYGHASPVRDLWSAVREARQLAVPDHLPVVVHTVGDDPEREGGAAEFDALLGDLDLYLVKGTDVEVFPASDDGWVWLKSRKNGSYDVELRTVDDVDLPPDGLIAHLVNGVDLRAIAPAGFRDEVQPGQPFDLFLFWEVWGVPPVSDDYSFSVQLYTTDGARWGQIDEHFLRTTYWHPGDRVRTEVSIPVAADAPPGGEYQVVIAVYVYLDDGSTQNVDFLDVAGNPAGQIITVPLGDLAP